MVCPDPLLIGTVPTGEEERLCHHGHIFLENSHSSVLSLGLNWGVTFFLLNVLGPILGPGRPDVVECVGVPFNLGTKAV